MAQRNDNSTLQGSAKGIGSKPVPGPLPVPKMESKAGKDLHIVDLDDGTKWIIRDETVVDLLKKHHSAPDQKTKDEILKILQSKVASSIKAVEASQHSKQLIQESKSVSDLESKISADQLKLKLKSDIKASAEKKDSDSKASVEKKVTDSKASDNSTLQESAKGVGSKPVPGPLPVPKMESKEGKELHIVDLDDGTKWIIRDETVVDLLKKHHSAPDQKTKDEILKILQSKVASSIKAVEASQRSKQLIQESKSASGLESKISADLQKLKLKSDSKASVGKKVTDSKAPVEKMDGDSKTNKVKKK